MKLVSIKSAKLFLGTLAFWTRQEPVMIEKDGHPMAVLISSEEYALLRHEEPARPARTQPEPSGSGPANPKLAH